MSRLKFGSAVLLIAENGGREVEVDEARVLYGSSIENDSNTAVANL